MNSIYPGYEWGRLFQEINYCRYPGLKISIDMDRKDLDGTDYPLLAEYGGSYYKGFLTEDNAHKLQIWLEVTRTFNSRRGYDE